MCSSVGPLSLRFALRNFITYFRLETFLVSSCLSAERGSLKAKDLVEDGGDFVWSE